ncbi:MAG: carboxypeptidase-like regulatory domain-containing protein [Planctomycetota bacterium]|nr:carboxypeptidase-like regulatory domain-containing protein [Planctomycetota bacterium]
MTTQFQNFGSISAVVFCAFIAGCGGSNKMVQVSGSVAVDGKPADGAALLFFPSGDGPVATATCNAEGKYKLVCEGEPGIPKGSYSVAIRWPDPSVKPTAAQKMTGLFNEGPDLLKGKYESKQKTTLKAEITASTTELVLFDLKSN